MSNKFQTGGATPAELVDELFRLADAVRVLTVQEREALTWEQAEKFVPTGTIMERTWVVLKGRPGTIPGESLLVLFGGIKRP